MKKLTASAAVLALVMSLGSAAFACGDGSCEPEKGNNGWGNGADTTNSGSFSGATSTTKSVNGPATDKFSGR
jgi:hypothetical protein